MENKILYHEIVEIIRKNRGKLDDGELTPSTSLGDDLGVDGQDAEEILEEYFSRYDIDTTEFNFSHYFGNEGFNLVVLVKAIFGKLNLKPVTISHLVKCAEHRKWIIPE
jgi:hypothetical protein